MSKRVLLLVVLLAIPQAIRAGEFFADVVTGLTELRGDDRIHTTDDHLRFSPRLGSGASCGAALGEHFVVLVSASRSFHPVSLRQGMKNSHDVVLVPLTGALLVRIANWSRVEPYVGAGIVFVVLRHGAMDLAAADLHVNHLAQPDHVAALLQSGLRVHLNRRWSAVVDARYGPAASTIEVYTTERPNHTLQANFHPLIVSTGVGWHF